jgi:hypothetical protein
VKLHEVELLVRPEASFAVALTVCGASLKGRVTLQTQSAVTGRSGAKTTPFSRMVTVVQGKELPRSVTDGLFR